VASREQRRTASPSSKIANARYHEAKLRLSWEGIGISISITASTASTASSCLCLVLLLFTALHCSATAKTGGAVQKSQPVFDRRVSGPRSECRTLAELAPYHSVVLSGTTATATTTTTIVKARYNQPTRQLATAFRATRFLRGWAAVETEEGVA
jgi:hypothetical protein